MPKTFISRIQLCKDVNWAANRLRSLNPEHLLLQDAELFKPGTPPELRHSNFYDLYKPRVDPKASHIDCIIEFLARLENAYEEELDLQESQPRQIETKVIAHVPA